MESYRVVYYKQDTYSSSQFLELCFLLALMGPLALQLVKLLASNTLSAGLWLEPRFLELRIITSSRKTGSWDKRCQDRVPSKNPSWNTVQKIRI